MHNNQKLRIISWNLNCGIFMGDDPSFDNSEKGTNYVAQHIERLDPDLVALQEILFPGPKDHYPSQATAIAQRTGLRHIAQYILSPSHLVDGARLGLAVLSRLPIVAQSEVPLPNPALELQEENGTTLFSHDKGFLSVRLSCSLGEVTFICGHLPPFHRFKRAPTETEFSAIWSAADEMLTNLAQTPAIGCIDFNTNLLKTLLPRSVGSGLIQTLIHQPTRPTGEEHDQIICTREWHGAIKILESRFDHNLCLADLTLKPCVTESSIPSSARPKKDKTLLLHLSDLHFGEGAQEDVDWKTYINFATRETRRDRLVQFVKSLPQAPDFVIVSGDMTIAGREDGYMTFCQTIEEMIKLGSLPPASKIVVVPGNHDVTRTRGGDAEKDRWSLFFKYIGNRFARPWIRAYDPSIDEVVTKLDTALNQNDAQWGGVIHERDGRLGTTKAWALPFLWDREHGILIYAFNSASISGSQISISPEVRENLDWLKNWSGPNKDKLQTIIDAFESELWVDPARIDPQEITLFTAIMEQLGRRAPSELEASLKIAVLHHHVTPIIREEVTKFEILLNAGRFKKELRDEGFHVVVHGHKHWPEVLRDAGALGETPLYIISGGTIGGGQASSWGPGFSLLEYDSGEPNILYKYITLHPSGNPSKAIARESVSVLPLSERSQEIAIPITRPAITAAIKLPHLLQTTERSLMSLLRRQTGSSGADWIGWSHALDENRVSIIATAYGLLILAITRTGSFFYCSELSKILESLIAMRNTDGGWSASSQSGLTSQPEPTAFALRALHTWGRWKELEEGTSVLEKLVDPVSDPVFWQHVYSLSTVGRALAQVNPKSDLLPHISRTLIEAAFRDGQGRFLYWSRQTLRHVDGNFGYVNCLGSAIHSAHAIHSLVTINKATKGRIGLAPEELQAASDWLLVQDWSNTAEDINRLVEPGRYDKLSVKHFTAAWAVAALLEVGCSTKEPIIQNAIRNLLNSQKNGLWDWGSLERPIWATHDALCALLSFVLSRSNCLD